MSISLRTKASSLCRRSTQLLRPTTLIQSPHLNSFRAATAAVQSRSIATTPTCAPWIPRRAPGLTTKAQTIHSTQNYSTTTATPSADSLIEEIQDAYEIAKDEFEIATESTDGGTIYAPSDRDSARDALNELLAIYHLYAARPGEEETGILLRSGESVSGSQLVGGQSLGENGPTVDAVTAVKTEDVPQEVKDEVRKRIGQRIREIRNAVELLEERAHDE